MATFNGQVHLPATLDTLARQRLPDWELILVDDGSTDDTIAYVEGLRDPRIRIIALPQNVGPVRARNVGFAASRGRYIAALDADDLCHPERLRQQVRYLDHHHDVVLVATAAYRQGDDGRRRPPHRRRTTPVAIDWLLHVRNPLTWSSVMMRADALSKLDPPTRPDYLGAEDYDLYHRLRAHGQFARIDRPLVTYRNHAGGLSKERRDLLIASATRVLAERYRPLFKAEADERAAMMLRAAGLCEPVGSRAALHRLGETIVGLRDYLSSNQSPGRARILRLEAAATWWSMVARAIAAGGLDRLPRRPSGIDMWSTPPLLLGKALIRRSGMFTLGG